MFPLEFTIESDKQNIENAASGNAVVGMGPSLWPTVTDSRIKYTKTISWLDYAPNRESSTAASRVVLIPFVTTTALSNLAGDYFLSTLRIFNDYFVIKDVKFIRDQTVIPTQIVPYNWDFNDSSIWGEFLASITSRPADNFSRTVNGLTIGLTGTSSTIRDGLRSGTDSRYSLPYVSLANTANYIRFSNTYSSSDEDRVGVLRITASNGGSGNAGISLTVTGGATATAQNGTTFADKETKEWKITIPRNASTAQITINPSPNTAVRFYKLEWYPLGN